VWQWMYHPDFGLLNHLLTRAGLAPLNWLGDPKTALFAVMLVSVWTQLGYQLTVFLAGLRAIPQAYLDAARVDGANAWQRFWRVTFPLLLPVTLFVLVTGIIGAFQVLALVMVLTGGGPLGTTDVIVYRIYRTGWELQQFGDASAMALLFFALLFGATWAQLKLLDRRVEITGPVDRKMIINALNSGAKVFMADFEGSLRHPVPENFAAALVAVPFGRFLVNSVILSLGVVAGQVLTSATAAYAFARLRFPGRDRVFLGYLGALLVPAIVLVIPRFLLIDALGWADSYQGLISTELVSVSGIFLLRQFFRTLPRDLEDAARLEGAGEWTIFWRVVVPLSRPALGMLALLGFADQWRSFVWPLAATRSSAMQPLEVAIANLQGTNDLSWSYQMATAVAAVIPLMVLYFIAQRWFIRGIEMTATGNSVPT